ncbi:adaptor protein MecA [Pradoshia sp.]|uniref:adaptor protein MecA n=1 Tax=Pradoshia sp. TaxID=2651281 RepID=UPI003F0D2B9F
MKLKRINAKNVKVFVSQEELEEKEMTPIKLKIQVPDSHLFFYRIVIEALEEMEYSIDSNILMDIYSYPGYGIYMMIQTEEDTILSENAEMDNTLSIQFVEQDHFIFEFADFEDVVEVCKILYGKWKAEGYLYHLDSSYYLKIENVMAADMASVASILLEYGELSTLTEELLLEKGLRVYHDNIIPIMMEYFNN